MVIVSAKPSLREGFVFQQPADYPQPSPYGALIKKTPSGLLRAGERIADVLSRQPHPVLPTALEIARGAWLQHIGRRYEAAATARFTFTLIQ